jgi:predicted nuclease with TOPRIM domain
MNDYTMADLVADPVADLKAARKELQTLRAELKELEDKNSKYDVLLEYLRDQFRDIINMVEALNKRVLLPDHNDLCMTPGEAWLDLVKALDDKGVLE